MYKGSINSCKETILKPVKKFKRENFANIKMFQKIKREFNTYTVIDLEGK